MKKMVILLILLIIFFAEFLSGCNNQQQSNETSNKSPIASCSCNPNSGDAPLTVTFIGTGIDPDGEISSYYWDFGDGETSTLQNPTHIFQSSGSYTVIFTVKDSKNGVGTDSILITVNEAPSNKNPTCSLSSNKYSGDTPFTVTFVINANDEDGSISFWELDINNDGSAEYSDTGYPPSGKQHTYQTPGTYTAELIVTDNNGATCYDTVIITVSNPPPQPIKLSGYGDDVSSSFYLIEGIAIFDMTYSGGSNFIIWLYNADTGDKEELLVNEIGSYSGKTIVGVTTGYSDVKPGKYVLDVTASGSWQVIIEQPNPSSASTLPRTYTGSGADVPSPFMIESGKGAVKFKMHHTGSSNFIIWLYHVSGDREELLVNEIGYYDGSKLVSVGGYTGVSPGVHYIAVDADGSWSIEISYL
ncbi:MAG: PKD domain-containing protein [Candidatus Thermoplasmatota archaeon]|nr:PKD domain-containing protein [Candidatus Thermoplasmatota archaeon]